MARRPELHPADELLSPALARTLKAIDPPESDAALVALARVLAATLDRMSNAERVVMAGQTAPQVLKVLEALEARAAKRRGPERPQVVNPVHELRRAVGSKFSS
jgi:hypothetical protein